MMLEDVAIVAHVGAVQRPGPRGPVLPVVCVARPGSGLAHLDGPCQCFFGGPPPEFVGDIGRTLSR